MSRKCIVAQCGSAKRKKGPQQTSFHELPSDPARRNSWIKVINECRGLRTTLTQNDYAQCNFFVCGRHFRPDSFFPGSTRLNRNAVPTIFESSITQDFTDPAEEPACKKIRLECITTAPMPPSSGSHSLIGNAQPGLIHNSNNNS